MSFRSIALVPISVSLVDFTINAFAQQPADYFDCWNMDKIGVPAGWDSDSNLKMALIPCSTCLTNMTLQFGLT